ncbi:MAG: hypothetical protein R6V28_04870 [Nitriliruptoraceae bacterium]
MSLLALTVIVLATPAPVVAQTDVPAPSVDLTLTGLTGILGPGSVQTPRDPSDAPAYPEELQVRVLVDNDGEAALSAAQLVVEVHPPMLTRGSLATALDGELRGPALHVHSQPLTSDRPVEPGEVVGLTDRFLREEIGWAGGVGGVHPVRIAVTLGTVVLDEVVTAVVWLNEEPTDPLLTTLIWPLDTVPWRGPGGSYPIAVDRQTRPGGRLDRLIGAVERAPSSVPVVLAPAAHLLEDLSDRSDGYVSQVRTEAGNLEPRRIGPTDTGAAESTSLLRRLRETAALAPIAPVSSSYANADLAALLAGDAVQDDLAAIAAVDGRRRLQRQLGVSVDGATHLVGGPIDEAVLDVLPSEILLLPAATAQLPALGTDPELGPPVRTVRAPSGRLLTALIGDPYLAAALDRPTDAADAVEAGQRVLAETAMAHLTAPGSSDRGLLLLPERAWDPPGAVAEEVLLALDGAPWLRFVSPTILATEARRGPTGPVLAPPAAAALSPELGAPLSTTWTGLQAAADASPAGTSRLEDRPIDQLRADLLRATSRWFRGPGEATATALVQDVSRVVDTTFGAIEITAPTVTLTSDTGQVPVTLERDRGGPLRVTVALESQGRLQWPEGRTSEVIELTEAGTQTVSFATQAVSTGTFPVTVIVTDPTGSRELARTSLSVRSTAISRPALTATAVLVGVLLLVGSLRRGPKRPRLEVVRDTASTSSVDEDPAGGSP